MARLRYSATGFSGAYAAVNTSPAWTWLDAPVASVLHAALTVGREHWAAVYASYPYSTYEAEFRANLVRAFLMEYTDSTANTWWAASPAFGAESPMGLVGTPGLEPSEKGAVSFFLGMAMTSLLADRLLHVPWILHYSTYASRLGITRAVGVGRSLPDFVALDPVHPRWFQFESKGRSRYLSGITRVALQRKAKRQAGVRLIYRGAVADLRVASLTEFDRGVLRTEWLDPDDDEDAEPIRVDAEPGDFVLAYYQLLLDVLGADPAEESHPSGGRFRTVQLEHADLRFGLDADLFDAAKSADSTRLLRKVIQRNHPVQWHRGVVGRDGVLIEVGDSWRLTQN